MIHDSNISLFIKKNFEKISRHHIIENQDTENSIHNQPEKHKTNAKIKNKYLHLIDQIFSKIIPLFVF